MDGMILTREALKLSAAERAHIIDALWESLDPADQAAVDRAWIKESRDRLRAYREGKLVAVDGEEVLRHIETDLGK
jgi:putative addiction module component (TIGR02574 family)